MSGLLSSKSLSPLTKETIVQPNAFPANAILLLRYRRRLNLLMATFYPPTERVMSLESRVGLLALANSTGFPIVQ